MSGRTQAERLQLLAARLSDRDQAVVRDLSRLRFLTSGQLARLHFSTIAVPTTRSRRVQHQLRRLVELGVLLRLQRRQGGVRAGSSGYTYATTAEGERLAALLSDRPMPSARLVREPGSTFVAHTLACSEVFVRLVEAQRAATIELLEHQAEPACWRDFHRLAGRATLKPDGFAALGIGELEHRAFMEVDRGTEGATALRRKLAVYVDYWRCGAEQTEHGVFPRIVWIMDRPARVGLLGHLVTELPRAAQQLFVASDEAQAITAMTGGTR